MSFNNIPYDILQNVSEHLLPQDYCRLRSCSANLGQLLPKKPPVSFSSVVSMRLAWEAAYPQPGVFLGQRVSRRWTCARFVRLEDDVSDEMILYFTYNPVRVSNLLFALVERYPVSRLREILSREAFLRLYNYVLLKGSRKMVIRFEKLESIHSADERAIAFFALRPVRFKLVMSMGIDLEVFTDHIVLAMLSWSSSWGKRRNRDKIEDALHVFEYLRVNGWLRKERFKKLTELMLVNPCWWLRNEVREKITPILYDILVTDEATELRCFQDACEEGDVPMFKLLRSRFSGIDPLEIILSNLSNYRGQEFIIRHCVEEGGVDINHVTREGQTFIDIAAQKCPQCILVLIRMGIDVRKAFDAFCTLLRRASFDHCQLLIDHGFNINAMNPSGHPILHVYLMEARSDNIGSLVWLIQKGADVNLRGGINQRTPLDIVSHITPDCLRNSLSQHLIKAGAFQ
jgi:hypothetical protein